MEYERKAAPAGERTVHERVEPRDSPEPRLVAYESRRDTLRQGSSSSGARPAATSSPSNDSTNRA